MIYQGHDAEKKIYLYHHDHHFDVITKVAVIFAPNATKDMTIKRGIFATMFVSVVINYIQICQKNGNIVPIATELLKSNVF